MADHIDAPPDPAALKRFIETIADMRPGGIDQDDDSDTINSLRRRARKLLGEDPDAPGPFDHDDEYEPRCSSPGGHAFECTGTAYGGDDERWFGEGRCFCVHCGADGDA